MTQLMLSRFERNPVIFQWDVEYMGYSRPDDDNPDAPTGYIDFHVIVTLKEKLISVRDKKTYKKVKRPGYRFQTVMSYALPDSGWETYLQYENEFPKDQLNKAIDTIQNELLNIQDWIETAESRADLIPKGKDVFECMFCGWVTDTWADDITCSGCGKRFWSDKLLS